MTRNIQSNTKPDLLLLSRVEIKRESGRALHDELRSVLSEVIWNRFKDGDIFFTESILESHFRLSKITVRRALSDLSRDGLIVRTRGKASIVSHSQRREDSASVTSAQTGTVVNKFSGKILGIIANELYSEYFSKMIQALSKASVSMQVQLRCYSVPTVAVAADILNEFTKADHNQAFVVFSRSDILEFFNRLLLDQGRRTVCVESVDADDPFPYIITDSRAAVTLAFEHLVSLGHRRIVQIIHEDPAHPTVKVKIEQFRSLVAEHGLQEEASVFVPKFYKIKDVDLNWGAMDQLWEWSSIKPTAIMTVTDYGAWSTVKWLTQNGFAVPGDVSVIGFENVYTSAHVSPSLTTVAHPVDEIARRVIQLLWAENFDRTHQEYVKPHLVLRESTGPVRLR